MRTWKLLLPVPLVCALSMAPQGPEKTASDDVSAVVTLSELQYTTPDGSTKAVSARSIVEIRVLTEVSQAIRLELVYDNGDYSMVDVTAFHLLRNAGASQEVKLVRGKVERMRFPRLP
jgi:hypothetical protein